jgi:hypothetical protein
MKRGKVHKDARREKAMAMKLVAASRTVQQKLARLDKAGYTAKRERARHAKKGV